MLTWRMCVYSSGSDPDQQFHREAGVPGPDTRLHSPHVPGQAIPRRHTVWPPVRGHGVERQGWTHTVLLCTRGYSALQCEYLMYLILLSQICRKVDDLVVCLIFSLKNKTSVWKNANLSFCLKSAKYDWWYRNACNAISKHYLLWNYYYSWKFYFVYFMARTIHKCNIPIKYLLILVIFNLIWIKKNNDNNHSMFY